MSMRVGWGKSCTPSIALWLAMFKYYGELMKNGHCPKCQTNQIYRGTALTGDGRVHLAAFPRNVLNVVEVEAYVCLNCGYTELYADTSSGKLNTLAQDNKYWHKVSQP